MRRFVPSLCLCLVVLALPVQSLAASTKHEPVVVDPARFDTQRAAIETALRDGKTYAEIDAKDRTVVNNSLDRMDQLIDQYGSLDAMPPAAKVELFNEQEKINTLLTKAADDSRLVCTRETPVGSHKPVVLCKTVAERRIARQGAQDVLRSSNRKPGKLGN